MSKQSSSLGSSPDVGIESGFGPLDGLRAELLALDPGKLVPVNVDATAAAMALLAAVPGIRKHRAELIALLGEGPVRPIDRLETLACAVLQSHAQHRAEPTSSPLPKLATRARKWRSRLYSEMALLVARGLVPFQLPTQIGGASSYEDLSFSLLQLVAALRQRWSAIEGSTGVDLAELDEAERAANELVSTLAIVERGAPSAALDLHRRAFTLMSTTYDQVRRLMVFLRWTEGDAAEIAPALLDHRRGRVRRPKKRADDAATRSDATGESTDR